MAGSRHAVDGPPDRWAPELLERTAVEPRATVEVAAGSGDGNPSNEARWLWSPTPAGRLADPDPTRCTCAPSHGEKG